MILAYTKCVIIKNFQNRYFVLCTIISPACIQFQNLAKQTKVHCKYFFFNYCTFLYVGAKLCSVRRVLASFCFAVLPPCPPPPPLYLLLS